MNPLILHHLDQYVNDFSGVLPEDKRKELNELFAKHEQQTTEQVVVVLFPHRQGSELLDIGLKLFNENKIGQKNLNNGLLLVIATEEKKIRIITGKGMEIKYPAMRCREIIENHLRPLLNAGKYEELIRIFGKVIDGSYIYPENTTSDNPISIKAKIIIGFITFFGLFPLIFTIISQVLGVGLFTLIFGLSILFGGVILIRRTTINILLKIVFIILAIGVSGFFILVSIGMITCESRGLTYTCEEKIQINHTNRSDGSMIRDSSSSSHYDGGSSFGGGGGSSFGGGGGSSNGGGWGD